MSDEDRWYYGLGPSQRDVEYEQQREEQRRAEAGMCITCGYWRATVSDQCEACSATRSNLSGLPSGGAS